MIKLTSFTLAVVMFAAGLVLIVTPTHAQKPGISSMVKGVEAESGIQVAARVEGLKRDSVNVLAALHMFEKWGHRPKIEEASSISGRVERPTTSDRARNERSFAIRKSNFTQTIREDRIEMVFVPVLDTPTEWQGTMIARLYNQSNQVVSEEVFNLVMVPDGLGRWSPVYELSFVNGTPFVHYESGMFAAFALGVAIAEHPAVTGSAPDTSILGWQLLEPQDPCPLLRPGMNRPDCEVVPFFRPASYRDTHRIPRALQGNPYQERFPGRCLSTGSYCNNVLGLPGLIGPRVRQTAHDAFPYCVGAGITGGGLPGFARGCGSALIYQAGRHIFRIW